MLSSPAWELGGWLVGKGELGPHILYSMQKCLSDKIMKKVHLCMNVLLFAHKTALCSLNDKPLSKAHLSSSKAHLS